MLNNKNKSEIIPYQNFLKRLVVLLSSVMIAGFLFIIILIGYSVYNLKPSPKSTKNVSIPKISIPVKGKIKSIDLSDNNLTILIETEKDTLKIYQISLLTGSIEKEINLHQK